MKVVICGAGQVGFNIAKQLSVEDIDVTVVDQIPDLIKRVSDTLDVRAIHGHASDPAVLERCGLETADMLIAVTFADEVNMVACQVAHTLFKVPTKIARVRAQNYLDPRWGNLFSRDHMPIDVTISPEIEVAQAVARRLEVPGATNLVPFADDLVRLVGVKVSADTPIADNAVGDLPTLFPDLQMRVVGAWRNDRVIAMGADDQVLAGDEVYFVARTDHVPRAMATFGYEEPETSRVVILGGGNIGTALSSMLEEGSRHAKYKIIESRRDRAELISEMLPKAIVLHGDALDPEVLGEANISSAEAVIAVTNDDEVNVIASLLAKRLGARRSITLVNNTTYDQLIGPLGIDVVVNPRTITVSRVLQHVRKGKIIGLHSLRDGAGELIEAEALETTDMVGKPLGQVKLPPGIALGAVVREKEVIMPAEDTVIVAGDRLVLLASRDAVKKVERMFSVRLEFF